MLPTFELFGKTLSTYAVTATIGILLSGFFACRRARKAGLDVNDMIMVLIWAGIGVLIGGHTLYGLTNLDMVAALFQNFDKIKTFSQFIKVTSYVLGGSVFYGGLIGAIISASLYIRRKKLPFPEFADIFAPAAPLFHTFGRIGCFLGGCCYGKECDIGFTYTNSLIPDANGVSRFPIQLLEAAFNLTLFLILFAFLRKGIFKGKLFYIYLCSYSVGRFLLEFGRGDELRGFLLCFSTSQWISICLFIISGTILISKAIGKKRGEATPAE